jgi:hypothetical protein
MRRLLILIAIATCSHDVLAHDAHGCLGLIEPVARGQALTANVLQPVACPSRVEPVQYDAHTGLIRASTDLAAGDVIREVSQDHLASALRGQHVTVVRQDGPITVARAGIVLTDAAAGRPVVIAASDGSHMTGRFTRDAHP